MVALANTGAASPRAGSADSGSEQRWAPDAVFGIADSVAARMNAIADDDDQVDSLADAAMAATEAASAATSSGPGFGAVGFGATAGEHADDMPMHEPDATTAAAGIAPAAAAQVPDAASDAFYSRIAALAGTFRHWSVKAWKRSSY